MNFNNSKARVEAIDDICGDIFGLHNGQETKNERRKTISYDCGEKGIMPEHPQTR